MMMHQCSHLEEQYVRLKLGDDGDVHRLLIDIDLQANHYDFDAGRVSGLMTEAEAQVGAQLAALGYPAVEPELAARTD